MSVVGLAIGTSLISRNEGKNMSDPGAIDAADIDWSTFVHDANLVSVTEESPDEADVFDLDHGDDDAEVE